MVDIYNINEIGTSPLPNRFDFNCLDMQRLDLHLVLIWDEIGTFRFHPKSELQQNRNTILYKADIQMTQKNMVPILGVIYY